MSPGRRCSLCCLVLAALAYLVSAAATTDARGGSTHRRPVGRATIALSLGPLAMSLDPRSANVTSSAGRGKPLLTRLDDDLATAPPGTTIHLASGRYAEIRDFVGRRRWVTISGRGDRSPPVIDGAELWGAQHLRLDDLRFSSTVGFDHSTVRQYAQPASHIELENSTVDCDSTRTEGVGIRGGSQDITLAGDTVEDCGTGLGSIAQDRFSRNIDITRCTFQHFAGQAIDLGGLSGVTISHSVIADISDPMRIHHNDGILFFGNNRNIVITDDVLADSRNQLILIEDPYAGRNDHTSLNEHIVIAGNVIYGAGAVAVQDQGAADVAFVENTMWHNHFGSLWLLRSSVSGRRPRSTVIVGNLIQGLLFFGASPTLEAYNFIDGEQGQSILGRGDLENLDPRFVSVSRGDFGLLPESPAVDAIPGSVLVGYLRRFKLTSVLTAQSFRDSIGAQQPGGPVLSAGPPLPASNFVR